MKALGIILAGGSSETLSDYPNKSIAALPVGGSYRTIDFTMSNMTNSGVNKVAVIMQYSSRSLLDHLSSAKWWDLGRKQGGLFVFTPYITNDNPFGYRGTADAMYRNISFLKRSNEPFVIIASGKHVYKIDFNDVLEYHQQKQADITIIYKEANYEKPSNYGVMVLDENKRLIEFEEKPLEPQTNIISLGIYVIPRTLLIKLLEDVVAENRYDFVNDVIIRYRKKLKIGNKITYIYVGGANYWQNLDKILLRFNEINIKKPGEYFFIILTTDIDWVNNFCIKNSIKTDNMYINQVPYNEVGKYLNASDFGIIIRENNIINYVASPTKVNEYLACGLKIINDLDQIGKNERIYEQKYIPIQEIIKNQNDIYRYLSGVCDKDNIILTS